MMDVPRVRMFAGPNGSGKSIIKKEVRPELIGVYVNPDEIERQARDTGAIDLSIYEIGSCGDEMRDHLLGSPFITHAGLAESIKRLTFWADWIDCKAVTINSYVASVIADFLRQALVRARVSFSFETVMSHPGKIEFLRDTQSQGYRTYLYYVATADPDINVRLVANRVLDGGHDVPEDKIRERYIRSLDLLYDAIRATNRAYIWDNNGRKIQFLAEITDGRRIEIKSDTAPAWFKHAVLDKIPRKERP
jgi:predicted ABC-type ATPase